jgi:Domain of unknown function (DUF4398)
MSLRTFTLSMAGALVCVSAAGCATEGNGVKPTAELTKAHTVLEQADKGGAAQRYAAADLQRAHDELAEADRADAQKRYAEARYYAQRAEVDADVAVARGNAGEQQKAAADVAQANNTLQQESQRNTPEGPARNSPPQ